MKNEKQIKIRSSLPQKLMSDYGSRVVLMFSQKRTQQPGTADGNGRLEEWGHDGKQ